MNNIRNMKLATKVAEFRIYLLCKEMHKDVMPHFLYASAPITFCFWSYTP